VAGQGVADVVEISLRVASCGVSREVPSARSLARNLRIPARWTGSEWRCQ
jgi:hypothetical protein